MNLPHTIAERCVHSIIEVASCRACVDACPQEAWILDDTSLSLNYQACDGCGLCKPACPEGSIEIRQPLSTRSLWDHCITLLSCAESGVIESKAQLPCIHSLGLQEILRLYNKGVRHLVVATGDCNECPKGGGERLDQRLAPLNHSLAQAGQALFNLQYKSMADWNEYQLHSSAAPSGPVVSRRGFFHAFIPAENNDEQNLVEYLSGESRLFTPLAQLLPGLNDDSILPHVPEIDPHHCSGCNACIRVCPHQALDITHENSAPCYHLLASQCTGCGICMDICDQEAITIHRWTRPQHQQIPLQKMSCSACGVPFHEPVAVDKTIKSTCRICSAKNHHSNLFQIL